MLAIDPGIDTGWALFFEGVLRDCGVGEPPSHAMGVDVIIERPQVYSSRFSKGDPNDLITLAIGVGRYVERYEARGCKVRLEIPHTWKGTLPKDIHARRVLGALTPDERATAEECGAKVTVKHGPMLVSIESKKWDKDKRNNMVDAIGLGKWALLHHSAVR